jgi:hypothetical protein
LQQISGYLYPQIITVVKNSDLALHRENTLFYAKPLQIYKGVDNRFKFVIRDSDQKPVSLLQSTVLFNLIDPTTKELVFSRNLDLVYTRDGVATCLIEGSLLDNINGGFYNYSIVATNGEGEQEIVFSDDNYNAQGQARILDAVYPQFTPSYNANNFVYSNNSDTNYMNVCYTSSFLTANYVRGSAVYQTLQYQGNAFTGNVELQASLDSKSTVDSNSFITVNTITLNNFTGCGYANFQGKYRAIRLKLTQTSGALNYIYYRP